MDRRRAAGALLALAACIACSTAAPTASNQTALELLEGPSEGCYYNFQHYGEGDRIMTNEPCLNCTCHNRMLMCYLKVCPFTKAIGQDCTIEKRADQCCPIVTCPDVPVDLLTSTSTTSPAEYGATGLGKVDKYGCSINGKYFPEGSKVPPAPNKPCEHCYCIRNMTTCVMQECTLHVDGCTPIYNKDVCCPVRYSCDHLDDEMLLLDDMTTTERPTPGFLLTTTTMPSVTQISQNCIHDDQIFADGALIKTEIACEHCYCMKGDIVCVVQECGTPMENEGKNCTSLPPRQGQCCPDTYICEGDEISTETTTSVLYEELTTLSPPRRVEGSGYRNEPDEPYTELPTFEGSGEEHATTLDSSDLFTSQKQTPQIIDDIFAATEESFKPSLTTDEPDKEQNTVPDVSIESTSDSQILEKTTLAQEATTVGLPSIVEGIKETDTIESKTTISDYHPSSGSDSFMSKDDEFITTTESAPRYTEDESNKMTDIKQDIETETTDTLNIVEEVTTQQIYPEPSSSEANVAYIEEDKTTTLDVSTKDELSEPSVTTTKIPISDSEGDLEDKDKHDHPITHHKEDTEFVTTTSKIEMPETTSVNPVENEIGEDLLPPGRIPGEGDCLLNGVTYKNNTDVPNINNCHSSCKCMSSIVKCNPIICSPPPEHMDNMNDCQPMYDTPDACCPTYVCNSRETIPPESHSQMSGTESPKPSPESECPGEQCEPHKVKPISPELCNSADCKSTIDDQERECQNGVCEHTETSINTASPPLKHPEVCVGDTCLTSTENCADGKCQPATTICNNENGCQSAEACEGPGCAVESDVTSTSEKLPVCNSEDCKDIPSCNGPECETSNEDNQGLNENSVPSECTEENCRRKEQSQDHKSPTECSGSSCITQEVEDASNAFTTETADKIEIYKESTTETISSGISKLPGSEETPSDETQKDEKLFEATTENQDISSEQIPDKHDDSSALSEPVTDKGQSYTDSTELQGTKMEETSTEIYDKPATEYYQTNIPDTYTTKSKEQVTDSIYYDTKQTSTEFSLTTQYEEQSNDLPKEDISSIPTKSSGTSTETLDIVEESSTNPTDIVATTSKQFEKEETEQEPTKETETFTDAPEESSTRLEEILSHVSQKQETTNDLTEDNTESQPDILITGSSSTILPEISTEKHIDGKIEETDVTSIEIHKEVTSTSQQYTTEQSIQVQQTPEPHEVQLDETGTTYNELEKHTASTENPSLFTETIPSETTAHELYKNEEQSESSHTTEREISSDNVYTSGKTTESSVKDQENLSKPTKIYDTLPDKQDTTTLHDEIQEYEKITQPSAIKDSPVTETSEIPISPEDETKLPESPNNEPLASTVSPDISMDEILATHQPGISVTNTQEQTETIDVHDTPSEAASDALEKQTDTPIKHVVEESSITTEETLQDDTAHKESSIIEPQENAISTTIQMEELETADITISPTLSDKEQEMSTKYAETEQGFEPSGENTPLPEVHSTKLDESTSSSAETEKKTTETSTGSPIEAITTETLEQTYVDKSETPDYIPTNIQTQGPSFDDSTVVPVILNTEEHADSDDKTIPVSMDDIKLTEKPVQFTTPDTTKEYTEKQDKEDHVTESDITGTDLVDDIHKLMEHSLETTTESQDVETKSVTELQITQELSTTPAHVKDETRQTEPPMSLVTEASKLEHSDAEHAHDSFEEKTTQIIQTQVPHENEIKATEQTDTKQPTQYTESPQLSETPSEVSPEKESQSESSMETSASPEYNTTKVLDIHDEENTPPVTVIPHFPTDVDEKLLATSEYQDVTKFTKQPVITDAELYQTDVLDESTSVIPVRVNTEETEISTRYPETSGSIATVSYDKEQETKPEKDHTLEDVTEQTQSNIDFTTSENKPSQTEQQEHDDAKQTISPEQFTTKYPESLDINKDKQTDELAQELHTLPPEHHFTTEDESYTKIPVSHEMEIQSSTDQNQKESSEVTKTSNEDDLTTPKYQELTTVKEESIVDVSESNLSTTGILATESSELLDIDQSNRRTLSPTFQTVQPDQYTTEKQKGTELPETTKAQGIEDIKTTQEEASKIPEKEGVTSLDEQFDRVTSIPQVTEGDILLETETMSPHQDQELPITTESIKKDTTEGTLKPDTEIGVSEDINMEIPLTTEKDGLSDKTTVQDDLIKIPVDTMPETLPSEHTVQESETEISIPKETETATEPAASNTPVPLETGSETSTPIETDISIPKATEPSIEQESYTETLIPKETDIIVPEVTEPSILKETEISEAAITEASVLKESEADVSKIPEVSLSELTEASVYEMTEGSVPKETEISVSETTEAHVPKETEVSMSKVTEASISKETEVSMSEETEASISKVTDVAADVTQAFVPNQTEVTVFEITEASIPKETESPAFEVTETSVDKATETSIPKESERPSSEVTETYVHNESETSGADISETSVTESSNTIIPEVSNVFEPQATEGSVAEVTDASVSKITLASVSEVTQASVAEVTQAPIAEVTQAPIAEVTQAPVDEETQAPVVEVTKAPVPEETEAPAIGVTDDSLDEVTKASLPDITEATAESETSVPKDSESEIMNKEPEATTYKPKDEIPEAPLDQSPTFEPIHSSSETTPYLVELQEHTTKVDEDIGSVIVTEEDRTKAPETYQTERGDQPLDNLPDKFTHADSHEELTTKETYTNKDDQITTLPPEQISENFPDKTALTDEIPIPSESPIATSSDEPIGQNTVSSEEQSATTYPAVSVTLKEHEKFTTELIDTETATDKKEVTIHPEKTPEHEIMHEETVSEALIPTATKATTVKLPEEITTRLPVADDKPEEKPYSPTTAPELPKPGFNDIQPTEEIPAPDFPPSGSSGYGQEPDYVEEDQAFGPGTCRYGGKVYVSAQQIPRDDPCDFCFCFRSDIICLQQSCPPPIHGCHEEPIQGFCCPRYECPVSMATTLNVTTTTTTTTTTLPPHFLPHAYKGAAQRRGCQIKGHSYKVGEVVRASSGPCLHCTCGGDGQMKCDPKACTPEPMLRQMIAAAVSAKRRR